MGRKWYRWPENKETGVVPWFVILRRLIFWPLLVAGMSVAFVAVAGAFGISEARRFWRAAL